MRKLDENNKELMNQLEKYKTENEKIMSELQENESEKFQMRASLSGHERILSAVTGHKKNPVLGTKSMPVLKAAQDDHRRNETLAK